MTLISDARREALFVGLTGFVRGSEAFCDRPMTVPVPSKPCVIHGSSVELHLPIFVSRFKGPRAKNMAVGLAG